MGFTRSNTRSKSVKALWVTDPWSVLDYPDDTALRLMEECMLQKHSSFWTSPEHFELTPGKLSIHAKKLLKTTNDRKTSDDYHFAESRAYSVKDFDYIFYRVDPPVNETYLQPLRILTEFARGTKTEIVNPAAVLGLSSEKFEGIAELGKFYAPMTVSSSPKALAAFGLKEKKTVAKLVHLAQSKEILLLDWSDSEKSLQALSKLTEGFKLPVVLQRFFPEVANGETRLWFVDGKLLAHIRKMPAKGEFIINLWKGGSIQESLLNAREKKAVQAIGKHLKKRKIRLAAVDVIAGYITDFNFTSPALIPEMERVLQRNLSAEIVKSLF